MLIDGVFFYWVSWLFFVVVTFFIKNKKVNLRLSYVVLLTIISSNLFIEIDDYRFSLSILILIIANVLLYVRQTQKIYLLFVVFSIMVGYMAIIIWKDVTSMWVFIPEEFIIPCIVSLLIFILIRGLNQRLIIGILAMCYGELLYSFILISYNVSKVMGDLVFFDSLSLMIMFILLFHFIQTCHDYIYALLRRYKQRIQLPS